MPNKRLMAAKATKSPLVREALARIATLYRFKDGIRGWQLRVRAEHTTPLIADLNAWPEATRGDLGAERAGGRDPLRAVAAGGADSVPAQRARLHRQFRRRA